MMKGAAADDPLQMTWEAVSSSRRCAASTPKFERRLQAIEPSDIGCLIYTSGTTGPPKAVQLSHGAFAETSGLIEKLLEYFGDRLRDFLPAAWPHIAERMLTVHFPLTVGNAVYFANRHPATSASTSRKCGHTSFSASRVFEKIAAAAQSQIVNAKGVKGKIARWAVRTGADMARQGRGGRRPGVTTALAKAVASALVHKKAKRAMGFDRARYVACGAAPIREETCVS